MASRSSWKATSGTRTSLDVDSCSSRSGRGPVTDGLGATEAGFAWTRLHPRSTRSTARASTGVSAIGDVIAIGDRPHPQLAHVSSAEGILVAERIAGQHVQPLNYDHVPSCTYCDPEMAASA